ncbi:hypothetical protein CARUB_v10018287mg [Capsella rubella]|uniref:Uncharacterized protein n=1 Tax=Capsella rubella TaxID=81985 RepID=R0HII1_9BRAS|nr:hypothetical protein CARUB_v10018287mg [Capsella rubella]
MYKDLTFLLLQEFLTQTTPQNFGCSSFHLHYVMERSSSFSHTGSYLRIVDNTKINEGNHNKKQITVLHKKRNGLACPSVTKNTLEEIRKVRCACIKLMLKFFCKWN